MPDKISQDEFQTQEESVQCDFEQIPCVDTLQLILHDILEVVGLGRGYGEVSWCPVRAGWPPKIKVMSVFLFSRMTEELLIVSMCQALC